MDDERLIYTIEDIASTSQWAWHALYLTNVPKRSGSIAHGEGPPNDFAQVERGRRGLEISGRGSSSKYCSFKAIHALPPMSSRF
jgi:hypothetical protein